ncbi:MAG: DUF2973 domain-containing protein [Cyanobacteria bacterium P01_E01_bin.6]
MLHLVYIIAFTVLAFLAISNLIRNLMVLGTDSRRPSTRNRKDQPQRFDPATAHPELLDESGKVVREPYLVMRSVSVDDAREKLDALYKASPSSSDSSRDDLSES